MNRYKVKGRATSGLAPGAVSWVTWRQLHQQRTAGQRVCVWGGGGVEGGGEGTWPGCQRRRSGDQACVLQVGKYRVPPRVPTALLSPPSLRSLHGWLLSSSAFISNVTSAETCSCSPDLQQALVPALCLIGTFYFVHSIYHLSISFTCLLGHHMFP